jgi:excisionase family DNA binding protein
MAIIAKKTHTLAEIMTDADNKVNSSGYLTIEELSAYLSIKPKTLYARVKEIPHYKVGRLVRFRKDEIDAWMEKHRFGKEEKQQNQAQEPEMSTPTTEPAPKPRRVRRSRKRRGSNTDMKQMVRNTIDEVTAEYYSSGHGKSDQVKGSGKEV